MGNGSSWGADIWKGLVIGVYLFGCLSLLGWLVYWVAVNGSLGGYLPVVPLFFLWSGLIGLVMPGTAAKVRRFFLGVPPEERR